MKRCPPPRMYNLHLQVYLFVWPLNFNTLWRRNAASFFEAIVGWTGQILTGSDVPECCLVFLCVILSPNWEVFEVKALHWRAKRGSLECRIALLSLPPAPLFLLYKWQDNLQLSQGENESHDWSCWRRHGNVCEVMGSNVRVRVGMRRRGCVCLKLFSMIEKTFCNTFSCQ